MSSVRLHLLPLGVTLQVPAGAPLQDILFSRGVEFPCGGQGLCRGCRVKVQEGRLPITAEDQSLLTANELAQGWRLACRARAQADLQLDLAQWEAPVLSDDTPFPFTPQPGLGIAVDVGTTTLVAQLVDLETGRVLAVETALNPQARHGSDLMSRVAYALNADGQARLREPIRAEIGQMIQRLQASTSKPLSTGLEPAGDSTLRTPHSTLPTVSRVVLVGNTVMHHLFSGISLEPMAAFPFEPISPERQTFSPASLGWKLATDARIEFLPCLGSFVGSDLLAGILATRLHESDELIALVDLGTNGEIILGNRTRLLCTSAAAGPAFEGARIAQGMRAATGAISAATAEDGRLTCHVLGNGPARGICGSGLVDAAAAALDLGWIAANGRVKDREFIPLTDTVRLMPKDIRELQLAKGAIAAGLRILLEQWGAAPEQLSRLYLAGAFGNYLNLSSARRIGLLKVPAKILHPAGNTALLGAKLALTSAPGTDHSYRDLIARTCHVSLNEDPRFIEAFAEEMGF
jgi:uncharacterized 2Fe-2S/4Fe-4S cluster protein (DUF4445 family)